MRTVRLECLCVLTVCASLGLARQGSPKPGAKAPSTSALIADAMVKAKKDGKQIFLLFGASWCVPCHMGEAYLRQPKLAAILDKYYVFVKIDGMDTEKRPDMENEGAEYEMKLLFGKYAALPSYAILDAEGKLRWNLRVPNGDGSMMMTMDTDKNRIGLLLRNLHEATPKITMDDFWKLRRFLEDDANHIQRPARGG